ncbi:hypothetical protein SLA2020_398770 [Shorea laevis]
MSTSIPLTLQHSFHLGLFEWLKINCSSKLWLDHPKIPWVAFFSAMIWNIWLDKNHLCFQNSSNLKEVKHKAMGLAAEFCSAKSHTSKLVSCFFHPITWIPPQPEWFKLNSDGSSNHTCTKAGAGGVIRDQKGNWIGGFAKNLGFATNNDAELWGVKVGLELALKMSIKKLEVEVDSMFVVHILKNAFAAKKPHKALVNCCRLLIQRFEGVKVKHTYREANGIADTLAKHGAFMEDFLVYFDSVPDFCSTCYSHDRNDCVVYRSSFCKT